MHYARKELGEELYALTKLDGIDGTSQVKAWSPKAQAYVPRYSLGYLHRILDQSGYMIRIRTNSFGLGWIYTIEDAAAKTIMETHEDEPEDAACKLAIALAKANLIPKEGKTDATNS